MQQMSSDSLFLVMFADTALKPEKVGPTFSSFISMSILAIRCNSNLRVACVQTPPPLRKNNNCVRVVQESRVELVFRHLSKCQRQNKKIIIYANVYRNTVNHGDS